VQILILTFSISGIILFFTEYKNLKEYFHIFAEIFGIVAIIDISYALIAYFFLDIQLQPNLIFNSLLALARNLLVGTIGFYYLKDKLNIELAPFIFKKVKRSEFAEYIKWSLLFCVLLVTLGIIFLSFTQNQIVEYRSITLGGLVFLIVELFFVSFNEEIFVRLFLFGLFAYWLKKTKYNFIFAAFISSFIWSFAHFWNEFVLIKFVILLLIGVSLSYLMLRKGIESCILTHLLYNLVAYLFLGSLQ
jgi:membrane protease YdiL (CAAX protease family)